MSYFAQIRILDEDGENVARVGKNGELWVKLEGLEEVLIELKKMNKHFELLNDEEIKEEDL